jgi:hypothetical protein
VSEDDQFGEALNYSSALLRRLVEVRRDWRGGDAR